MIASVSVLFLHRRSGTECSAVGTVHKLYTNCTGGARLYSRLSNSSYSKLFGQMPMMGYDNSQLT